MMKEWIAYGAVYLVEAVIAWLYLEYLFDRKRKRWLCGLSFLAGYIALLLLSRLDSSLLNALSFTLVNVILIAFLYRCGLFTALVHGAFLCFVMLSSEILVSLVITLFGYSFSAYTQNFSLMLTLIIWSKLLYVVFAAIGAMVFLPHEGDQGEPKSWLLFVLLPASSTAVSTAIVYIGMEAGVDHPSAVIITIAVASLLVMNLLFLGIYNHVQRMHREHMALQLAIQRDQADAAHYQALQDQFDNQRILIHDIKNHLHTIDALAAREDPEAISDYIRQLDASLRAIPQARLCTEPILNMLLLQCRQLCQEQAIAFQCDIRENCLGFLDATDMTTLFSNLLSNGREAAAKADNPQVELSVRKNMAQNGIIISLQNSCHEAPTFDGEGHFLTRKADRNRHGVGLKSIRRIVEKYGGMETLQYDPQGRCFRHILQFPAE